MLPVFVIDGGLLLAVTRAVAVAALLSLFGTLVFRIVVMRRCFGAMPADVASLVKRRLLILTQLGAAASVLGCLAWLVMQSADMAGATSISAAVAAVPTVLRSTNFGHLIALQFLVALAVGAVAGRRDTESRQRAALALATGALGLQAGHSHAASMYAGPSVLLASDVVHLFGAGAWLGGLVPLLLVVRDAPAKAGASAARWFSPMGKLCLVALAASAMFQGWVLVESIPGLVGTAYGWMVFAQARPARCVVRLRPRQPLPSGAGPGTGQPGCGQTFTRSQYRGADRIWLGDHRRCVRVEQPAAGDARAAGVAVRRALHPGYHQRRSGFSERGCRRTFGYRWRGRSTGHRLYLAQAVALGCRCGRGRDCLVRRPAPGPAVRPGLSDQLLPVADRLRGELHRPGGRAVSGPLRHVPRPQWAWRRPGGQALARAPRRPHRRSICGCTAMAICSGG